MWVCIAIDALAATLYVANAAVLEYPWLRALYAMHTRRVLVKGTIHAYCVTHKPVVCTTRNPYGVASACAYAALLALLVWSFLAAWLLDPGAVPAKWHICDDPVSKSVDYCATCHVLKPLRCHHCALCNRCVLRMDHHCIWVSNCVGNNNLKAFFLCALYFVNLCAYQLFLVGVRVLTTDWEWSTRNTCIFVFCAVTAFLQIIRACCGVV
eukprot:TRINITY_DN5813_c0_g1_i2.p2 TRINITY_DN5813_c0_g1~~TRINITY_DN5813_c0_g1_i2.p2  ORF type:complete len:210 (-),score=37.52 TRINITY_DN5813_c0_g1_i2:417-1046(-)